MTILLVRKLLLALCITGLVGLVGCGDPGAPGNSPEGGGGDGRPSDQEHVDGEDFEVDYGGFTIAPPPGPDDPFNPKESFDTKLSTLLDSTEVPSALGGAFLQLSRSYLSGRDPMSPLEESAFAIFDRASPEVKDAMARTLEKIDELPREDMDRLYGASFLNAPEEQQLSASRLSAVVGKELLARANLAELGEIDPEIPLGEESPGLVRDWKCSDLDRGSYRGPCPNVCRVRTEAMPAAIRTAGYVPALTSGQLLPEETEGYRAAIGGRVEVRPPRCKSQHSMADDVWVCMAVPQARAGETVRLEGFNFHDVAATVTLAVPGAPIFWEVDAHVRGDAAAGAAAPSDCNVRDVLLFELPGDLPVGIYRVEVRVGDPDAPTTNYTVSGYNNVRIEVLPPVATRFQFAVEELTSINDTGEYFSDEVGLKIATIPVLDDSTLGEMNIVNGLDSNLGDVDRGDQICLGDIGAGGQCIGRSLFAGPLGAGFGFAVIGYEIDNRGEYEETVNEYLGVVEEVTKSNWDAIAAGVGGVATVIGTYFGGPSTGGLVGALVGGAIKGVFWLWAPADLIIEDWGSTTFQQMAELTSVNYPNPPSAEYESELGVQVRVGPCEDEGEDDLPGCGPSAKTASQYRESRRYGMNLWDSCDGALPTFMTPGSCRLIGSEFQLTFRYNRLD